MLKQADEKKYLWRGTEYAGVAKVTSLTDDQIENDQEQEYSKTS